MQRDALSHHLQDLIFADFLHALDLVRLGTAPDEAFRSHEARVRPLRDMARQLEAAPAAQRPVSGSAQDVARLEDFVRHSTAGPARRAARVKTLRLCLS